LYLHGRLSKELPLSKVSKPRLTTPQGGTTYESSLVNRSRRLLMVVGQDHRRLVRGAICMVRTEKKINIHLSVICRLIPTSRAGWKRRSIPTVPAGTVTPPQAPPQHVSAAHKSQSSPQLPDQEGIDIDSPLGNVRAMSPSHIANVDGPHSSRLVAVWPSQYFTLHRTGPRGSLLGERAQNGRSEHQPRQEWPFRVARVVKH
jgi:hypothetical protein